MYLINDLFYKHHDFFLNKVNFSNRIKKTVFIEIKTHLNGHKISYFYFYTFYSKLFRSTLQICLHVISDNWKFNMATIYSKCQFYYISVMMKEDQKMKMI